MFKNIPQLELKLSIALNKALFMYFSWQSQQSKLRRGLEEMSVVITESTEVM